MPAKEFGGKTIEVDDEGFLVNREDWNEDIAAAIAKEEGLPELAEQHWKVIHFIQKEFQEKGTAPSIRRLKNTGGIPIKELYALFPNGPAKKAAKIAGLPKPMGCV